LQLQNIAHNTRLDFQKFVRWCVGTWTNKPSLRWSRR